MTENRSRGSQGGAIVVVKKRRFSPQGLKSNVPVTVEEKPKEIAPATKSEVSVDTSVNKDQKIDHFIKEKNSQFVNLDDNVKKAIQPKKEKPSADNYPPKEKPVIPGKVFDLSKVDEVDEQKKSEKKKITKIQLVGQAKSGKTIDNEYAARSRYIEARKSTAKHYGDEEVSGSKLRSLSALKRQREKEKKKYQSLDQLVENVVKEIIIPSTITVQELANRMAVRSTDVVKELMKMGMMITGSQPIDADTAEIVVSEFGHKVKRVLDSDIELILDRSEYKDTALMKARAPVISVMGHVDHGKTSLLDALRETDIVSSESGGITQHIGASKVTTKDGRVITFIDTPGHAAFTQMRMHGAKVTDMVILVVAADDGVKEQTVEAISHARAAGIPIIIAVNKIDKEGSDPKKVLNELLAHGVNAESLGGDCLSIEVSALKKINLDALLEAVLLQEELMALEANYDCLAMGAVVESKVDRHKGVMATFLVQHGRLNIGDIVLAGTTYGRVRAMMDEHGKQLSEVLPSQAVEILGLNEVPSSGEIFYVVESDKIARDIVQYRINNNRDIESAKRSKRTIEDIFQDMGDDKQKSLSVIIKADVRGSSDAIKASLEKLTNDKVNVKIIHSGVGGINDSDISLAKASDAIILGFNVRAVSTLKETEIDEVNIKYYSIIYNLVEDIEKCIKGLYDPETKEKMLGKVEIRKVFNVSKHGKIAGCYVQSGVARRNSNCRIIRDSVVIAESKIKVLKRFKDDAKEVTTAMECGISFDNFADFKEKDLIEIYELIKVDE
ncbi:MAG: translation initiation factor IF-2 [Rickettsiales bacterium]|jgi:translation initiation factor IF-2|nr:translation initiation factor IF-2 [Rickettsiales bacterium]